VVILLPFLSVCCSNSKNIIDYNDVESMRFWYISKDIEFNHSITNCGSIVRDTLINKDTIITDRTAIERYITVINRLKPSKGPINYDLRVTSLIRFKDKREDLMVCISMYNGVVLVEDVLMKEDKRIVKLLDEFLYDHLTERDWTPSFLLEE
jgi:hypothetical protein